jgi:hypothetical protein
MGNPRADGVDDFANWIGCAGWEWIILRLQIGNTPWNVKWCFAPSDEILILKPSV